ncbi:MAG: hypothetical protein QOK43_2892 [Acidimicrobiaceae bacterium]|nr:hypothetical protein [Acidimicrobiaceae bacterium]
MTACPVPEPFPSAHHRHARHWHAGYNRPGCLPEAEPGTHSSFEDAQEALADDMEFHARSEDAWAGEHPCEGETCETHGESCGGRRAEQIMAARGDLLRSQGPAWSGSAAGLAYWVTPCPGCEQADRPFRHLQAAAPA